MVRLWIALIVLAVVFYVYSILDCAFFDRRRIRALPKPAWVLVVIFFPLVGGILWFLLGRGGRHSPGNARVFAPDDDPAFLGSIARKREHDRREQDLRIQQLEKDLADLEDNGPDSGQPGRKDA